jgi:hypothetical protein
VIDLVERRPYSVEPAIDVGVLAFEERLLALTEPKSLRRAPHPGTGIGQPIPRHIRRPRIGVVADPTIGDVSRMSAAISQTQTYLRAPDEDRHRIKSEFGID